jgi:hypothetical protein
MGDSIAVGVGHFMPECRTEARVGITSKRFVQELRSAPEAEQVVISLGVNDGPTMHTQANLEILRRTVRARHVFWLLPAGHEPARTAIRAVANRFGDRLIDTAPFAGSDGLHPTGTGYRTLATVARTARESNGMVPGVPQASPVRAPDCRLTDQAAAGRQRCTLGPDRSPHI